MKQFLEGYKGEFNAEISKILQEKGYKGLLYSPGRYDEYELRMLNPDDVVMLDMRTQGDKALQRAFTDPTRREAPTKKLYRGKQAGRMARMEQATEGKPSSLGDIYSDIDVTRIVRRRDEFDKQVKAAKQQLKAQQNN